mmetsp:Transcript_110684/g.226449  ORF Transcript_110684/g.226449 Transcript_110684/m.226449 type:complete len:360 (+) Transcript_110684:2341-3420(+)
MDSFVPSRNSCIYILSLSCPLLSCSFLFLLLRFVLGESLRFTIFRNSSLPLSSLGRDVVLRKEVLVVRHGLEFQVVPGGVLEEHRVLLPRLPFEPQVGLDDEFHPVGAHPLGQVLELLDGVQRESGVRHGDLVPVDGVVVIDAPVVVSGPVADDLVAVEGIILPLVGGPALLAPQDGPIKFLCRLEGMDGKGIVEGIPGGRGAPCFVLRCRCCCCCCCCVLLPSGCFFPFLLSVLFFFRYISIYSSSSSSSSATRKGLDISSTPSLGDTSETCVPRTTTSPSFRFRSVTFSGSWGSLRYSSQSSSTRLTSSSYPLRVPSSSRPPRHLTWTVASISLASSRMLSFRGGPPPRLLLLLLLL